MHAPVTRSMSFAARWWTYQRERFPIFANGSLIHAFSFCAVSFSHLLRGETGLPRIDAITVAFLTCFLFFLQLRIADEFKDRDEDAQFRPYRPVPRGLVTLRELGWWFVGAALAQLILALWLAPAMVRLLLVPWIYLAGMSREFFVRDWLKARPITYLWSHMLIMPLVDFYAAGCDWLSAELLPPRGIFWFLVASFFNGIVLEIGRKLRAPEDEEAGVQTYTVLWGIKRASVIWLGVLLAAGLCAVAAAAKVGVALLVAVILGTLLLICTYRVWCFQQSPAPGSGKGFETLAGLWTLALYGSLGALPLTIR
ncbi:UbiA family prenyltransferase [Verrucomicrobiota bacterium sgz303538]